MTPDGCRGSFHVPGSSAAWVAGSGSGERKRGRKNPTQHSYHITNRFSSQRPIGPPETKSVPCTKTNVCIWETFRLEKLKNP